MKNRMISIGWTGCKTCYLNVSMDEAVRRYIEAEGEMHIPLTKEQLDKDNMIEEFEFDDEFTAYDVGRPYK